VIPHGGSGSDRLRPYAGRKGLTTSSRLEVSFKLRGSDRNRRGVQSPGKPAPNGIDRQCAGSAALMPCRLLRCMQVHGSSGHGERWAPKQECQRAVGVAGMLPR